MFQELMNDSVILFGMITSIAYFIFAIIGLILAAVSYGVINAPWSNNIWRKLAPTELAATFSAVGLGFIGIIAFLNCNNNKAFLGLYSFLLLLSFILSLACGIWSAIGGTIRHRHDGLISCDAELTGILNLWKNVDEYLKYSYTFMCSEFCPCDECEDFSKEKITNFPFYDIINNNEDDICKNIGFDNCAQNIKNEVMTLFKKNPNNTETYIKENKFKKYWKKLEKRFKCSGWCETNYINPLTYKEESMFFYLYNGLDKYPEYIGCRNKIVNWISRYLKGIASMMIICGVIQIFNFILVILLLKRPYYGEQENENEEDIESSDENNNLNNRKKTIINNDKDN
jgi:hypothetical protein